VSRRAPEPRAKGLFAEVITKHPHVAYEALCGAAFLDGARRLMDDVFSRAGDPDGNFVDDFQGPGFHTRLFELASFAYLEETGWTIERGRPHPDFLLTKDGVSVAVEAVTANPKAGRDADIALKHLPDPGTVDILAKCTDEFPIRMGGVLREKLKKEYWTKPKCRGLPFVLVLGSFHEPGSMNYVDEQLARYLYGLDRFPDWTDRNGVLVREATVESHSFGCKTIPSNFFATEEHAAHLSAVLWTNQFTISRFQRLWAEVFGLPDELAAVVVRGWHARDGTPPAERFVYEVGDGATPPESWSRGVALFVNPHARVPLPPGAFETTSTFRVREGRLVRELSGFHPLLASTQWRPHG